MKRLRSLLLCLIIGCIFIAPAAAVQAAQSGKTVPTTVYTKDRIRLRTEPRPTAPVVATLEARVQVHVNSCAEGWCSITTQGLTGYVLEEFLVRKMPRPPAK